MRIRIHYYASLRERRGLDEESIETNQTSVRALYHQLSSLHQFGLGDAVVGPAINDEFCDWDRPLCEGDFVVFIPPVAGG